MSRCDKNYRVAKILQRDSFSPPVFFPTRNLFISLRDRSDGKDNSMFLAPVSFEFEYFCKSFSPLLFLRKNFIKKKILVFLLSKEKNTPRVRKNRCRKISLSCIVFCGKIVLQRMFRSESCLKINRVTMSAHTNVTKNRPLKMKII